MKISEINLRSFRRFRQASISLDEGINVIKGPNESGKSTLVQAVLAAFYWKVDATRKEVRDSVTWGEDDGWQDGCVAQVHQKSLSRIPQSAHAHTNLCPEVWSLQLGRSSLDRGLDNLNSFLTCTDNPAKHILCTL
jgi:predicted ATP-binding protein involved in virulence